MSFYHACMRDYLRIDIVAGEPQDNPEALQSLLLHLEAGARRNDRLQLIIFLSVTTIALAACGIAYVHPSTATSALGVVVLLMMGAAWLIRGLWRERTYASISIHLANTLDKKARHAVLRMMLNSFAASAARPNTAVDVDQWEVFISYCRHDANAVSGLVEQLVSMGLKVWFDEQQIRYGDVLLERIGNGIERSSIMLICIGPSGLGSWQAEEVKMALLEAQQREVRLIEIALPGTPTPLHGPERLTDTRLAVDARGGWSPTLVRTLVSAIRHDTPP